VRSLIAQTAFTIQGEISFFTLLSSWCVLSEHTSRWVGEYRHCVRQILVQHMPGLASIASALVVSIQW